MLGTFINYLKYEKRYSDHTINSYSNDIRQFSDYLLNTFDLEKEKDVKQIHLRSWIVELMESGRNSRSINRKLSALKTYFNFLKRQGEIKVNPTSKIIAPKIEKRLPSYIQESEMEDLLDQIVFPESFVGVRDKMIIETLYLTGIRRAELISLTDTSIDRDRHLIKVLGKGKKERLIPVTKNLIEHLDEYINERNKKFENKAIDSLFVTDKGNQMYPKFVYNTVKRYLSLVSTSEKKSPHILRHSFATHLSNKGARLNAIKELLGHSNLSATQVYTHNSIEQLKKVYDQAHPKGK